MPRHDISASLPAHQVANTDLVVVVRSDDKRLGELTVSKGSVDWRPARHKGSISMGWETFDRLMRDWHAGNLG